MTNKYFLRILSLSNVRRGGLTHNLLRGATLAATAFALFAAPAQAAFLNGSAGAGWQVFPASLTEDNDPYFDNKSLDGSNRNIGHFLSGVTGYPNSPNVTPDWWGYSNGNADLNFVFQAAEPVGANLLLEVAGLSSINEFGWYNATLPNPVLNPIFVGSASAGAAAQFSPGATFGFYLRNNNHTFYSESYRNAGIDSQVQHFVVFRGDEVTHPNTYWIGAEDLPFGSNGGFERRGDFNDMVIRLTLSGNEVPEPGTFLLMGGGLLVLAGVLRKRNRQQAE